MMKLSSRMSLAAAMTLVLGGAAFANDLDDKMKMMDKDGDGVVSRAEFDAHGDRMFTLADMNGDGKVTKDEMKSGHDKMKKEMDAAKDMRKKS